MEKLNEIYTFAKDHNVVIDITFNRTDGIRIDMKDCPFCRSLYLSEQELQYNKVDIQFVLQKMYEELYAYVEKQRESALKACGKLARLRKEEENYES